ncbi:MAG: DUF115 domain-containing protein [Chlamydiales bacterium]|nr:DUF115 domain-containing protein [Chlamydiales bacterium]
MPSRSLQLLKHKNPSLFKKVSEVERAELKVCKARDGQDNLVDERVFPPLYHHSGYSPKKETQRWLNTSKYETHQVLYVYGLGLAYIFDELETHLKNKDNYLVFLEDDIQVILAFLNHPRSFHILEHSQVKLYFIGADRIEEECLKLSQYFIGLTFSCVALPFYERVKFSQFCYLRKYISYYGASINYSCQELLMHGETYFQNFYANWMHMSPLLEPDGLRGKFKGIPAIICGAGPSLEKNYQLLSSLRNKALLFAGGSSMVFLSKRGIKSHLGGSVDPNIAQYQRVLMQSEFELPIYFKPRVCSKAMKLIHGKRLFIGNSSVYPISNWLQKQLSVSGGYVYQEGVNVIHLLIDIAKNLGCNPIMLVGMDLAYTGMQSYVGGIIEEHRTHVSKTMITKQHGLNDNAFLKQSVYGKQEYTLWKWVEEAKYIADYAQENPELQFVNCTEGGLGIDGIEHRPLKEASKDYLSKNYDLSSLLHQELSLLNQHRNIAEEVEKKISSIYISLVKVKEICGDIERLLENQIGELKKRKLGKLESLAKKMMERENSLSHEVAFKEIVEPVGRVKSKMLQRNLDSIDLDSSLSDCDKKQRKWELLFEKTQFYKETAEVNLGYITKELKMQEVGKRE